MSFLELGTVAKAHGLRGEVKVNLHWAGSDALERVDQVLLRLGQREARFGVSYARASGKGRLVKFAGIDDRDSAEAWCGAVVCVERSALPALEPGEYYLMDLVGAQVSAPDGLVGKVVRIAMHPSVDALVIETPSGEVLEQPLLEHWLEQVDAEHGRVLLKSRDGLI